VLFSSVIVILIASYYDIFEQIVAFFVTHENMQFDVLFTLIIYLACIFGLLTYQKSKQLRKEVQRRIMLETELQQALMSEERANRAKSIFLATMSHELRTPLNSIIGFADMMLHGEGNIAKQNKYLNYISTSGKHLLSLINNILDISKIESGKMELNYETFDVYDTILEVNQLISSLAYKEGINVEILNDNRLYTIFADKLKFKQILFNLVSNAIKFTPKGGSINISTHVTDTLLQCSITDTGVGISEENKHKIFQPFTQLEESINHPYKGTGLGLSLVKQLVELHQGRIWFESELGKGTSFTFELPLQPIPNIDE